MRSAIELYERPELVDRPDLPEEDPRDVPTRVDRLLRWALRYGLWRQNERRIIAALWIEAGDIGGVANKLKAPLEVVERMLNRAKSEVFHAARCLDYEEGFTRTRGKPGKWKHRRVHPIDSHALWFVCRVDGEEHRRVV